MKKLIMAAALAVGLCCFGDTYTDGEGLVWSYTVKSGKATLTAVQKSDSGDITGTLVVPSSVNDVPVIAIGANVGAGAAITGLSLPNTLLTIDYGAFANCTALETLTQPDSLTTIYGAGNYNKGAFNGCTALKSVTFGAGLVTIGSGNSNGSTNNPDSYANSGAFGNCSSLESVTFGPNLVTIGHHAFSECGHLKSLVLPDSVQTIGINCFYNNIRLSRVSFGADLQLIDACAFMGCVSLNTVTFSAATTPLLTIKTNAFKNCVQLVSLTLSNSMPTLSSGAFSGCNMLRSLTIPSLMSTVDDGVFSGLANLREVTFLGVPPENLANAGLSTDVKVRYPTQYAEDWEVVIADIGFTDTEAIDPDAYLALLGADSRYELSSTPSDRSISSITIDADYVIEADKFKLTDKKVFDTVLRIVNEASTDVTLTLPSGHVYETFEGADPLVIPANSRNLLTITRTDDNVFLVSREKLMVIE